MDQELRLSLARQIHDGNFSLGQIDAAAPVPLRRIAQARRQKVHAVGDRVAVLDRVGFAKNKKFQNGSN